MFVTPGSRANRKRVPATTGGGVGTPGGVSGNIQFNSAGTLSGILNSSWDSVNSLFTLATNTLIFDSTGLAERMRITSSGLVNIGNVGPSVNINGAPPLFQLSAPSAYFGESMITTGNNASFNGFSLNKTRGTVPSSHVAVQQGDVLGEIYFGGSDGTNYLQTAAIRATVNSSIVGAASIPTALIFSAGSADFGWTDTLEIDQTGGVSIPAFGSLGIGGTTAKLQLLTNTTFNWHQTNIQIGNNALGTSTFNTKTRGSFATAVTIVQSSDELGAYRFYGTDGVTQQEAGRINFVVDSAPGAGSMPGRFSVQTTPTGTVTPVERMRVDSVGLVTFGGQGQFANTTIDTFQSHVQAVSNDSMWSYSQLTTQNVSGVASLMFAKTRGTLPSSNVILVNGDRTFEMWCYGNDGASYLTNGRMAVEVDGAPALNSMPGRWIFATASSTTVNNVIERVRIDSFGRVCIGGQPSFSQVWYGAQPKEQIFSTTSHNFGIAQYSSDGNGNSIFITKSRGTTPGTNTALINGDNIAYFSFVGADGTALEEAALIRVDVDGTPTNNVSTPARISLFTATPTVGPTERTRIDNAGLMWLMSATSTTATTPAGARGNVNETVASYNHRVYGGL